MSSYHKMTSESDNGHDILLGCIDDTCGRRVVFRRPGEIIVIDHGDFYALHRYTSDQMDIVTSL